MVDPRVVRRKLESLEQYLGELAAIQPDNYESYAGNALVRRAVERLLQLLVEVANDINVHAVVDAGSRPPEDYYDGFLKAAEVGLLSQDLAQQLAPSAGERNILVHEYEEINDALVYESIAEALELYRAYAREVLSNLPS